MRDSRDETLTLEREYEKMWVELATLGWKGKAQMLANVTAEKFQHIHRGAAWLHEGEVVVVFGNDGYSQDVRARLEVELLRQQIADAEMTEIGFVLNTLPVDDCGYTWAMLVETNDIELLRTAVWDAWRIIMDHKDDDDAS